MSITYQSGGAFTLPRLRRRVANKCLKLLANELGKQLEEVNYMFMTDDELLALNREYLQHDYYTDILTFDTHFEGESEAVVRGDIAISLDRVRDNASTMKLSFEDELFRVMAHGVLHLCGLNDHSDEESLAMRKAEDRALYLLRRELDGRSLLY